MSIKHRLIEQFDALNVYCYQHSLFTDLDIANNRFKVGTETFIDAVAALAYAEQLVAAEDSVAA